MTLRVIFINLFLLLTVNIIFARISESSAFFPVNQDETVIGNITTYTTTKDDSLIEIARRFNLGYNEITDANRELDPFHPGQGREVLIPTQWILPNVEQYEGIVINLPEMRLYLFLKKEGKTMVRTFPIGIGDEGNNTPTGTFKITQKTYKPSWYPPQSIRKERPELPNVVPPGPDNPLGTHAMRLSGGSYLIHGTNRPWAVGRRVTHGCLRLYPEDIPVLFDLVPLGTKVNIIHQNVKIGKKGNRIYVEVHDIEGDKKTNFYDEALHLLIKKGLLDKIDSIKLYNAIRKKTGVPTDITELKRQTPDTMSAFVSH
ncbi:MAG: L,D-transpeptidase family protein [Thermodesulfovibrionales bacterium]